MSHTAERDRAEELAWYEGKAEDAALASMRPYQRKKYESQTGAGDRYRTAPLLSM